MYDMSPYCAMMNNPITYNDPDGDIAPLVWAGIAIVGGGLNVWNNWDHIQNGGGWGAAAKAFGIGAGAAVVGTLAAPAAAVGTSVGATVGSFAAAGAVGGGVGGAIEGFGNSLAFSDGNFFDHLGQGLLHGAIGAGTGAAFGALTGGVAHWWKGGNPGTTGPPNKPVGPGGAGTGSGQYLDEIPTSGGGGQYGNIDSGVNFKEPISVRAYRPGTFNVTNWNGYPSGLPRPTGPFRLIEGAEYDAARKLANKTNEALRKQYGIYRNGNSHIHIHEIHPIKFGGSPTDLANKVLVNQKDHSRIHRFWRALRKR